MSEDQVAAIPTVSIETSADLEKIKSSAAFIVNSRAEAQEALKAINTSKMEVDGSKKEVQVKIKALNSSAAALDGKIQIANKQCETINNFSNQVERVNSAVEKSQIVVNDNLESITEGKSQFESMLEAVREQASELQGQQATTKNILGQINKNHERVSELAHLLLEDEEDENGDVSEKCLRSKLTDLLQKSTEEFSAIQNTHLKAENDFSNSIKILEKKITDLLPSAAAAGLAFTYDKAKKRYTNPYSSTFLYALFLLPLCVDAYLFYEEAKGGITPSILFGHFLSASPLFAIATFGVWSIRLYRRLYEEYSHKQSVMELYHGFKKEVDQAGTGEQRQKLIDIMLETVAHKPSLAMSKYEEADDLGSMPSFWKIWKLKMLNEIQGTGNLNKK
jgi:hypothetical protein